MEVYLCCHQTGHCQVGAFMPSPDEALPGSSSMPSPEETLPGRCVYAVTRRGTTR